MEVLLVSCSEVVFASADDDDDVLHVDVSSLYCRASREARREARPMAVRRAAVVVASMLVAAAAEVSSMMSMMVSLQEVVVLLST